MQAEIGKHISLIGPVRQSGCDNKGGSRAKLNAGTFVVELH